MRKEKQAIIESDARRTQAQIYTLRNGVNR